MSLPARWSRKAVSHARARIRRLPSPSLRLGIPFAVLVIGLLINAYVLVSHSEGTWFWADDWDLLFLRGTIEGESQGLLAAHNNHWFASHIVVYRVLFELFGLHYTPYVVAEVLFHLAVCLTLWLLLRRSGAGRWISVGAALVAAWYGLGAGAEIFPASMNHVGAILAGLVALLWTLPARISWRRAVMIVIALLISVMFGLTGLTLVVLVGAFALLRHGFLTALTLAAPPLLVLGAWYSAYGRVPGPNNSENFQDPITFEALPKYVWSGLTDVLGDGSGLAEAGPLLAFILVLALLRSSGQPVVFVQLAWAGVIAASFQLVAVAAARFHLGPDGIGSGHYAYIVLVLLIPAIALTGAGLVAWAGRPHWRVGLLASVLFAAYVLNSVTLIGKWQDDFSYLTGGAKGLTLGVRAAYADGQKVISDRNPDIYNFQLKASYLTDPAIFPAIPDEEPSEADLLQAQSWFFTAVGEEQFGLFAPAEVSAFNGLAAFEAEDEPAGSPGKGDFPRTVDDRRKDAAESYLKPGCHKFLATDPNPILKVETGETGTEIVVYSDSKNVATRLERGGLKGALVEWEVEEGTVHVATSAPETTMYVSFDGEDIYTVCVA